MYEKRYIPEKKSSFEVISKNNKFGIADIDGNTIIKPVFDYISIDSEKGYVKFELRDFGEAVYPISDLKNLKNL